MKSKLAFFSVIALLLVLGGLLINVQSITPAPHLDDLNSGSLLDTLYAILLVSLVLFIASGLGALCIRPFKLSTWPFLERAVFGLPLGLAVIGYGELFLGLVGWIRPIHHLIFLVILSMIAIKESIHFLREGFSAVKKFRYTWRAFSGIRKIIFVVGGLAILFALFETFTPPYDYDGLMYHLQGPRLFLEAGRINPIPENWFTFYPAAWEMLFMMGMGLGSDIFARLISFATLLIFLLATYVMGKRFLPAPGGFLSAGIVLGVPMVLVWGGFAYIDLAWSLFQFLAVGLLLIWIPKRDDTLLILSGIMQGLALGTKYTAFSGAGIIGMIIVLYSVFGKRHNRQKLKRVVLSILRFAIPTIIVASPWYLKNFLWTGNPTFPFFFKQEIINPVELEICLNYLSSFGTGHGLLDYILLPFTIFTDFSKFSTFTVFGDYPNPVMLLSIIYPLVRKRINKNRDFLDLLFIITILQFVVWAVSSQQSRFLIPLFPGVSIIASAVILQFPSEKLRINWTKTLSVGAVGGMLLCLFALMGYYFIKVEPYKVLFGIQSKDTFLSTFVNDYEVKQYINVNLPENATVFLPWDGRGYYCDGKCIPDIGQSVFSALIQETSEVDAVSTWMQANGITHILLSQDDANYFIYGHDPDGVHQNALTFFIEEYAPRCSEVVYEDDWTRLYELHLDEVTCK